ncbi:MAG: AAA family ATPase [Gammaproteobacteria bacterium]
MLRSFRLANHRSFRDEHELLLIPSYDNDHDVVPVAAVFGANASGKSNFLDGLRLMSDLVRGWSTREPGSGIPRSPYRLDPKSLLEPSSFQVELVLDGVPYAYGIAVDDERVTSEWLHAYPRGRRRVLFEREYSSIVFGSTITHRARAEVIENLLTEDTLFLAVAARLKADEFQPVVGWFHRSLLFGGSSQIWRRRRDERLARFVERSDSDRAMFLELARAADVGISDITVEYVDDPRATAQAMLLAREVEELEALETSADSALPRQHAEQLERARSRAAVLRQQSRRAKLLVIHGNVGFELSDESEGTRLWLDLLPQVINSLASGSTLVIDEIDTSLHPLLVRKLVGLFRDPAVNLGRAQLLFTTHDAFLLAPVAGEPGVERDQVWFVEKHPDGASELYPLTDFKPRTEHNLARRYLGGAYGAVPILDGFDLLGSPVSLLTQPPLAEQSDLG